MKLSKMLSATLALLLILSLFLPVGVLSAAAVPSISGETSRSTEEIILPDGRKTGVTFTEINISGTAYGNGKALRVAQCSLSNTNLSIEVLNCGKYTVSQKTVSSAAAEFSTDGRNVLCALNGDLWMTGVNSNSNVTKKVLQTTRGIMIIDREVWATQEFGMENYKNTSIATTVASQKSAFGVTDENQPLVGAPNITVNLKNETKRISLIPDGLNRLPAWDSLVVYNHRINSANYALNDSYEIELLADSTAFTLDNKVTATVKAIYPEGSTTRPSIGEKTIILTARGSRIEELRSSFSVGDRVSFELDLNDEYGRTDMWERVVDAIGGHMQVINNGRQTLADARSSEYPTSLIGVRDDGTVMFATMNSSSNGVYKGLRYKDAYRLCTELGYNSVFYLDGGGSSSIVTLKNGTYTQRNYSSDGTPRAVVNAVAMVWNEKPVCEKQGSLSYLTQKDELAAYSPEYLSAGMLAKAVEYTNALDFNYITEENLLRLASEGNTIDPYLGFDMGRFSGSINTAQYKYITLKIRTNINVNTDLALYYNTSAQSTIQFVSQNVTPSGGFIYVTFNMAPYAGWQGELSRLRVDIFEGITSAKGQYVDIEFIAFSKLPREVNEIRNGNLPIGTVKNYYAYKDCNGKHSYTAFEQYDSDLHKGECFRCGYTATEAHKQTAGTVIDPTCTAEGLVVFQCAKCQKQMGLLNIPKANHTYSDSFTVDKEPTAAESGVKSRHCLYCDAITDETEIPPLTVKGDINGDGRLNAFDAQLLQKIISGYLSDDSNVADISRDGVVNLIDVQILKRILVGISV